LRARYLGCMSGVRAAVLPPGAPEQTLLCAEGRRAALHFVRLRALFCCRALRPCAATCQRALWGERAASGPATYASCASCLCWRSARTGVLAALLSTGVSCNQQRPNPKARLKNRAAYFSTMRLLGLDQFKIRLSVDQDSKRARSCSGPCPALLYEQIH